MNFELIAALISFFAVIALMMAAPSQSPRAVVARERAGSRAAIVLQNA